ncbi:MAG TPA: DNA internalization-related competence protein ComEC/Rec2 [Kiritimatiellia bacterium]|nr:DNA internalization-related competence protein ComEC/Rec2 [Kiritimatiellia bacterium]HRZ12046.1 DNA internalization-related competence protein ComEC/Rec2 [Kiritimatiellia bacterium]HSA19623.1 DNA internalization-related competence protein ComEC/Rec2 [Kiritimatiellia bacterium]
MAVEPMELAAGTDGRASPRRPFMGLAAFFLAGVGAGLCLDVPCPLLGAGAALLAVAGMLARHAAGSLLTGLAVLLAGWLNVSLAARSPSPREVHALMARDREQVELVGLVTGDSVTTAARREGQVICRFSLRVEGLHRKTDWERARGTVSIFWRKDAAGPEPRYGERWVWRGVIERRPRFESGGGGSLCGMTPDPDGGRKLSSGHGWKFVSWCLAQRRACFDLLGLGLERSPDVAALLRTLLLGYRQELSPQLLQAFSTTGTLHIISISGLHVGIMVVLITALLKALGRPRPRWALYLAPALLVYSISTGLSASTVRATIMAMIFWAGPLFRRRPDGLSALALSAILILAFAPLQLVDLGFVFSYSAVAALMMWYPVWVTPFAARLRADPWAPPESKGRRILRQLALYVFSMLLTTAAVWITTTPLSARFFNLVAPMALPSNLLVIPLSFVVLVTGVLTVLFGALSSWMAEVFNHANRVFTSVMLESIEWFSSWRGGYTYVPTPPAWFVAAWFAWMALLRMARRRAVIAAAGLVMLGAGWAWILRGDEACADVLDVGQGQAVFLNLPGSRDVLVDTGPRFSSRDVIRHLRRHGVNGLRALVLTHGDAEHIGGTAAVLDALPVDEIWCAPHLGRSPAYRELLADIRRRGIPLRALTRGDRGLLPGGLEWEVLHPPADRNFRRSDEATLVLRVGREATALMIMGGADGSVEQDLVAQPADLGATVLVTGDHGAEGTCRIDWLERVGPVAAVISVGLGNVRGQPDRATLSRLREKSIPTWRTDESGPLRIPFQHSAPGRKTPAVQPLVSPAPPVPGAVPGSPDRSERDQTPDGTSMPAPASGPPG